MRVTFRANVCCVRSTELVFIGVVDVLFGEWNHLAVYRFVFNALKLELSSIWYDDSRTGLALAGRWNNSRALTQCFRCLSLDLNRMCRIWAQSSDIGSFIANASKLVDSSNENINVSIRYGICPGHTSKPFAYRFFPVSLYLYLNSKVIEDCD